MEKNKCNHDIVWDYSKFLGVCPLKYRGICKKCKGIFVKEGKNGKEKQIG